MKASRKAISKRTRFEVFKLRAAKDAGVPVSVLEEEAKACVSWTRLEQWLVLAAQEAANHGKG
jgi:hypothetical protein